MASIVLLLSTLLRAFPLSSAAHEAILSSKGTLQLDVHVERPRKHLPAISLLAEKKIEGSGYDLDLDQSVYDSGDTPGSTWKAEKNNEKKAQQLLQQEYERAEKDRVVQEKAKRDAHARQFEEEKSIEGAAHALMRDASIQALAVKYLTQRPEKLAGAARGLMRKEIDQADDASLKKLPAVEVEDLDRTQWFGHHPARQNYGLAASAQENEDPDHDNSENLVIQPDAHSDDDTNTLPGDPGGFADGGAGDGAAPDRQPHRRFLDDASKVQFDTNSGSAWKQTPPEGGFDKAEGAADGEGSEHPTTGKIESDAGVTATSDGANADGSETPESDAQNVDEGHSTVRSHPQSPILNDSKSTASRSAANAIGSSAGDEASTGSSVLDEVRKAEVYRIAKAADDANSAAIDTDGNSLAPQGNSGAEGASSSAGANAGAKGGSWVWVPSGGNAGPDKAISAALDNDGLSSSPPVSELAAVPAAVADGVSTIPDAVSAEFKNAISAASDNAVADGAISIPHVDAGGTNLAQVNSGANAESSTLPRDSDGTDRASLAARDNNFQEWMSSIVSGQGDSQSGSLTSGERAPVYRPVGGMVTPDVDASDSASEVQQDSSAPSPKKDSGGFSQTGEEPPPGDASFLDLSIRKPPSSKIGKAK